MKTTTKVGLGIACVSAAAVGTLLATRKRNQVVQTLRTPNKIEKQEFRMIHGIPQFLYHRGEDQDNPVILYLHGGPGEPASISSYLFQREWEKDFTIVHWDQRLSGKTYLVNQNQVDKLSSTITVHQLIEDTKEIVEYLKEKYHREKIIILGHSWGSVLGTLFIRKYPQLVAAYVGVGQVVSMKKNEELGYQKTVEEVGRHYNPKDLAILESLLPYPPETFDQHTIQKIMKLRSLQQKYDLASRITLKLCWQTLTTPVYHLRDLRYVASDVISLQQHIMETMIHFDLFEESPHYDVPVIYLLGDHDWQTPYVIAQSYFDSIEAPSKQLILIPGAGHATMMDQPQAFTRALKKVLKDYR